ncbi:MAG: hypothetical protein A2511_08740 [Deltaproteobacteria bacterium RIFOXYD12_FULL_50_9]|nr:MAG: hypothetical protein A2511_08740 [Deltaproteobacteria bacterium RIFOXYD12_FULL_50_9]
MLNATSIKIADHELQSFADFIMKACGIHLDQSKGYLLESRLMALIKSERCQTFSDLYAKIIADSSGHLQKAVVDALTTNETSFFRDAVPYELLRNKIIPDLIDRRRTAGAGRRIPLRIWSAACSFGQEVYSIAITLLEMKAVLDQFDISILGSDISTQALARASYGQYNDFEVKRGLPADIRQKYFRKTSEGWRICDEVRALAKFESINLMSSIDRMERFDIILCRNVAIYFTQNDKVRLFQRLAKSLVPDGALIIGGSESLTGISSDLISRQYLRGIYYQLRTWAPLADAAPASPLPPGSMTPQVKYRKTDPRPRPLVETQRDSSSTSLSPVNEILAPGNTLRDTPPPKNIEHETWLPEAAGSSPDHEGVLTTGLSSHPQKSTLLNSIGQEGRLSQGNAPLLSALARQQTTLNPALMNCGKEEEAKSSLLAKIQAQSEKKLKDSL